MRFTKKIDLINILNILKKSNFKSFLVTLKILKKDPGFLSFPIKGYTLAFDIPVSANTSILINQLNQYLLESKGKIYLTKDSTMSKLFFQKIYGNNLKKFKKLIRTKKNKDTFASLQSERLGI